MEAMIQKLKNEVVDQVSYLDCVNKRLASAMQMDFTEDRCNDCARLHKQVIKETARLSDLRQSLFYLRRAAGHENVDVFNPERF